MNDIPPLAVTMGEPSGIGGEIILKAWQQSSTDTPPYFVLDSPLRLQKLAGTLGLSVPIIEISDPAESTGVFAKGLPVLALEAPVEAELGNPDPSNAAAVIESIRRSFELSKSGRAAAIVTSPIQKESLYRAKFTHPGHTEYLAYLDGPDVTPVMMLASPMLRVVPITVHMSLHTALETLTTEMIIEKTVITARALKEDFNIARPRLAIAGLNPHAGEQGTLGDEEDRIITPAISALRNMDIADFSGPVPPDALFTPRAREGYDAAICMYHDQALIPIKALDVDRAVNVTLGLSVVRTSPDHGTALDIADKGVAAPTSIIAALDMAKDIASLRREVAVETDG